MAAADKVMEYVERELAKDPEVSNATLFEGAKKISRAVGKLTPRQFHAKYPLQVKRRNGGTKKKKTAKKSSRKSRKTTSKRTTTATARAASGSPEAVRKVMLKFAQDLSAADGQSETIGVLAKLDRYVADVMKAARN